MRLLTRLRRPGTYRRQFNPDDDGLDDAEAVQRFWDWCDADCRPAEGDLHQQVANAATSSDPVVLSATLRHSSGWVRLAAAANPSTPERVRWGDGVNDLGLAGDPEPWVRAVVLLHLPRPPAAVVEALAR